MQVAGHSFGCPVAGSTDPVSQAHVLRCFAKCATLQFKFLASSRSCRPLITSAPKHQTTDTKQQQTTTTTTLGHTRCARSQPIKYRKLAAHEPRQIGTSIVPALRLRSSLQRWLHSGSSDTTFSGRSYRCPKDFEGLGHRRPLHPSSSAPMSVWTAGAAVTCHRSLTHTAEPCTSGPQDVYIRRTGDVQT